MRFTAWLWDQVDDLGVDAGFAKLCWDDANNGCASPRFSVRDWVKHFDEKHEDSRDELTRALLLSFTEYKKSIKKEEQDGS